MGTLLLNHISTLATFDGDRRRLSDGWILIRDEIIEDLGTAGCEPAEVDQRLDLSGHVVLPGLINTHHHFFQSLLRNVPNLQDAALFRWLGDLYFLMSELTDEDLYTASLINHAELLLSGCTTTIDHHYIKVNDMKFDTCIKAAQDIGIRFHLARGSFSIGQSAGGLPPDHIVEDEDEILMDCERLIKTYHDPNPRAMVRVDLAPCSPYSVSPRLMKESIQMARRFGVGSHTHLADSPDEEHFVLETYGKRSVQLAEEWGWVGEDVWYAHATCLSDEEIDLMARTGTGVSHCPNSNMYMASGCCPVPTLLKRGITVGLGVDGSASNNSSNMLDEVRSALMLQRVFHGSDALSPTQALEIAILGGAKLLRRDEIGVIAPGKAADIIAVDYRKLPFAGGLHDPVAGLVMCASGEVDLSIVNGSIRVSDGQLVGVDLASLISRQNELAEALIKRVEKRSGISFSTPVWRRAYPYDPMAD